MQGFAARDARPGCAALTPGYESTRSRYTTAFVHWTCVSRDGIDEGHEAMHSKNSFSCVSAFSDASALNLLLSQPQKRETPPRRGFNVTP